MADRYMEAGFKGEPIDFHFVMDSHGHLGQHSTFLILDGGPEGVIRVQDSLGVDMTAVSSIEGTIAGWKRGNDLVIDAAQRFPDKIFGYITVNAHEPESVLPECERCWDGGCRGLKLHTNQGPHYDDPVLEPALAFANEKGCPILCHVWGWELDHMEALFPRYPDCTWILAHAGSEKRERYIEVVTRYPNTILETCYSVCLKGLMEWLVQEAGDDNVMWGSDLNFMGSPHQLGRVLFADLSEESKKKLLCDNARRVFKLDD
jgi:predicted TIM-barrel fold metal-dependent hydrolase